MENTNKVVINRRVSCINKYVKSVEFNSVEELKDFVKELKGRDFQKWINSVCISDTIPEAAKNYLWQKTERLVIN